MGRENVAFQIRFWTLLGPLISLVILFLLLVKGQMASLFLALIVIGGILLCLKWKRSGLGIALLSLLLSVTAVYLYSQPADRFWYLGVGVAIGSAFFISHLSFEEVDEMVAHLQEESLRRWDHLWGLDERWRRLQERLKEEKRSAKVRLQRIEGEGKQKLQQMGALEKLVEIARQEMELAHRERCRLKKEVHQSRIEVVSLNQQLHEKGEGAARTSQKEIEGIDQERNRLKEELAEQRELVQSREQWVKGCFRVKSRYKQLGEQFQEKRKTLDSIRAELFHVNEELLRCKRQYRENFISESREGEREFFRSLVMFHKQQERKTEELQLEIETLQEVIRELTSSKG